MISYGFFSLLFRVHEDFFVKRRILNSMPTSCSVEILPEPKYKIEFFIGSVSYALRCNFFFLNIYENGLILMFLL